MQRPTAGSTGWFRYNYSPRVRFWHTLAAYCGCFCCLGMCIAAPGPALLQLEDQIHEDLSTLGWVFTCRAVGALVANFAAGAMLGSHLSSRAIVTGAMAAAGAGSALIPLASNLPELVGAAILQGWGMGSLDIGGNLSLLWLCADPQYPVGTEAPMQAIHCLFGVGALLSPVLVKQALHEQGTMTPAFLAIAGVCAAAGAAVALLPSPPPPDPEPDPGPQATAPAPPKAAPCPAPPPACIEMSDTGKGGWEASEGVNGRVEGCLAPADDEPRPLLPGGKRQWPEAVRDAGRGAEPGGAGPDEGAWHGPEEAEEDEEDEAACRQLALPPDAARSDGSQLAGAGPRGKMAVGPLTALPLLAALTMFLYEGLEVAYGSLITAFSVRVMGLSEAGGQGLASVYWAGIALGRLLAIPLALRMSSRTMLGADLALSLASLALVVVSVWAGSKELLWASSGAFGLGMASVFPCVVSLIEHYIVVTGPIGTVFLVGGGGGEFVIPGTMTLLSGLDEEDADLAGLRDDSDGILLPVGDQDAGPAPAGSSGRMESGWPFLAMSAVSMVALAAASAAMLLRGDGMLYRKQQGSKDERPDDDLEDDDSEAEKQDFDIEIIMPNGLINPQISDGRINPKLFYRL